MNEQQIKQKVEIGQIYRNARGWERQIIDIADHPKDGTWAKYTTKASKWVKVKRLSGKWVSTAGESQEWWITETTLRRWGNLVEVSE